MSYTHDRDITLEGWIVHTSQANAKGTRKEHRNPILESRCKSKRGMKSELVPTNLSKLTLPPLSSYIRKKGDDLISHPLLLIDLLLCQIPESTVAACPAIPSCPEDRGRILLHRYWRPQEGSV